MLKLVSRQEFWRAKQRRRGRCTLCGQPKLAEGRCRLHFVRHLLRVYRVIVGESGKPLPQDLRGERDRLVRSLSRRLMRQRKSEWRPVSLGGALILAAGYKIAPEKVPALARVIRRLDRLAAKKRIPQLKPTLKENAQCS